MCCFGSVCDWRCCGFGCEWERGGEWEVREGLFYSRFGDGDSLREQRILMQLSMVVTSVGYSIPGRVLMEL